MAAGEAEVAGSPGRAPEMEAGDVSPSPKMPSVATFGFTPAQQMMFQSSSMNGHQVVMVTPEVARSLGIVAPSNGDPGTEAAIQIQEDTGDVSVSLMETEEDGMIDPDQFLAMELASGKAETVVDEDLTSLSWLHSKNLLKASDVQFRPGPMSSAPLLVEEKAVSELSEESPTSDYLEEMPEPAEQQSARAAAAAAAAAPAATQRAPRWEHGKAKRHPPHLPYDPREHVHFKPPFSFSCLIFMSIEDSPNKALPVKEIYGWILERFPFYQSAPIGWKNSVRHNLSLNKCFKKLEKSGGMGGKGSLWTVDPLYRPNLIQALKRSPCVQSSPGCGSRGDSRPWTAAATALSGPPPPPPLLPAAAAAASSGGRRHAPCKVARARAPPPPPPPLQSPIIEWDDMPAAVETSTPRRRPGRGGKRPGPAAVQPAAVGRPDGDSASVPNPELFPFLSRRLQASGDGGPPQVFPASSAAAAAADDDGDEQKLVIVQEVTPAARDTETEPARCRVRIMKRPRAEGDHDYGPAPTHLRLTAGVSETADGRRTDRTETETETAQSERLHPRLVVITRSPEEEHTYACDSLCRWMGARVSDDEAFSDDSNLSLSHDPSRTSGGGGTAREEAGSRFVEEGADLLLTLAGVLTPERRGRRGRTRPAP